jgi:hypothetical protein
VSLSRLWAFLAIALPTLGALIASLQSVDLTYHLRAGGEIFDSGAIPTVDTWTFTAAGQPWTDQQWGAQVVLAAVYRLGGWTGLVILRALLVAVIFGCLFEIGRRRGLDVRLAAWLTLVAFAVSAPALALRPQLLGMALFAVVLLLVVDRRAHPERLWAVPVIVIVWANLHGSFLLGPVVLGLAWLEDVRDRIARPHRTLVFAGAAAVAACVTPFGPAVWAYAIGLSVNPEVTQRITEWQRTSPFEVPGFLFYASAVLVVAIALLLHRRGRATAWPTLVWLGLFFVIGAFASRGIAWWSLGGVLPVAGLLAQGRAEGPRATERPTPPGMGRLNVVVASAITLAGIALLPVWRPIDPGTLAPTGVVANAPSGITAALRDLARPGERVLNPQVWGSWFEFALPDLPVAIDSRIEFFPPEVWDAYDLLLSGADSATAQLREWGVTIAVLAAPDRRLPDRLDDDGWRTVYADDDGWIMVSPDR